MRYSLWLTIVFTAALLGEAAPAIAQTEAPERAVNERYRFAFTFESGSLVSYEEGGVGFSCIHNPQGGGEGTEPDYGLLVYGSEYYRVSAEEAEAAKLDPPEEQRLSAQDVHSNTRWSSILKAVMALHEHEYAGDAVVQVEDGPSVKVPYFKWSRTIAGTTRHALMFVVLHGDAFITLQVECARPMTKQQETWFTTKLELLKPMEAAPSPSG